MNLQRKNILITGAGQGIGAAIAARVSQLGGTPILVDLQKDKVVDLAEQLGTTAYVGNVTDPDFVDNLVEAAAHQYGTIDGLVNNAGIIRTAMARKMTREYWHQVIDVNLNAVFYCSQAVGKHMIERAEQGEQNPGAIVNISSIAGRRGTIGQVNYGAAKSGVLGITMSCAKEWGRYGIRVNSACFGLVETEMTETVRSERFREKSMEPIVLQRFSTPAEVAVPVCFLLSEAAGYITGQHLSVDGGAHIGF